MRSDTRLPVWALLCAGALLAPCTSAEPINPNGNNPSPGIEAAVHDGLLTLDVAGSPLGEVIRAIGKAAGFGTSIEGDVDAPVTRSLIDVPLEHGLRYLLDDVPHVIFYAPPGDGETRGRLLEVRIYGWARHSVVARSAVAELVDTLQDPRRELRLHAIRKLAKAVEPDTVVPLGQVLKADTDPVLRGYAAGALGAIGEASALPALQSALGDSVQSVRIHAIRALAQIDSDQATRLLGTVLLDGSERRGRLMAAWALGRQGGVFAQTYLEAVLDDPDDLVAQGADRALSQIMGSASGWDPL